MVYLITGKAGAGKTHYGDELAKELRAEGFNVRRFDGDVFRLQTNNTDFTDKGRISNLMNVAKLAHEYELCGDVVILSFIAPRKEWRDRMRAMWNESRVIYIPGGTLWDGTIYEKPTKDEN